VREKGRLFYDVAYRQRLGMKMELACDVKFAALHELATSGVANGNLPVCEGLRVGIWWVDEGA
jgi:hypothetical protein